MKDQIAQAKEDQAVENARMATERAELEAQAYRIRLDQNASEEVMRRRYRSHLPSGYEPRNLLNTLGAGGSAPPPAQVLSDLFDALATLLVAEVDAATQDQHNAEIAKVKDQIAQAKADREH